MANTDVATADVAGPLVIRPEFEIRELEKANIDAVAAPLPWYERVASNNGFRKVCMLLAIVGAWQAYTVLGEVEPLMFPKFSDTAVALWDALLKGELAGKVLNSFKVLLMGYGVGLLLAAVLTAFAALTRIGNDLLSTLAAMFNPLPAIALLPLSMMWFGLGTGSLVFVLVHSVLWPVALNTHSGFQAVSETQRMVGRNYGLRGIRYVTDILIPAAFPSILTGMKTGWAFAWRTLIAAELIFGTSGQGGLGWFIFEYSQNLMTAYVFAGLFTVILIGVLVENLVFRNIEIHTVAKWGMQR
jgi:NitT/TauT family transport system permease protein